MKTITRLALLAAILIISTANYAQNLIAVQNGGTPKFYASLDSAITHSSAGDTLFLPGGSYSFYTAISKRLHFIGTGYHPDSTSVTLPTQINGDIGLQTIASGGSMTGINFTGKIYFGNISAAENYTFFRCKINQMISYVSYSWSTTVKNNKFYENTISSIFFGGGDSNYFINNIFGGISGTGSNNLFKNNIFLSGISTGYYTIESTIFENNIFISNPTFGLYGSNYFSNNILKKQHSS